MHSAGNYSQEHLIKLQNYQFKAVLKLLHKIITWNEAIELK